MRAPYLGRSFSPANRINRNLLCGSISLEWYIDRVGYRHYFPVHFVQHIYCTSQKFPPSTKISQIFRGVGNIWPSSFFVFSERICCLNKLDLYPHPKYLCPAPISINFNEIKNKMWLTLHGELYPHVSNASPPPFTSKWSSWSHLICLYTLLMTWTPHLHVMYRPPLSQLIVPWIEYLTPIIGLCGY